MTTNLTQALFIADFPEFDGTLNLDAMFNFYFDLGQMLLNRWRWPTSLSPTTNLSVMDRGLELFVAHNIALELRPNKEAAAGSGAIGQSQGPLGSKSAGGVSASYAVGASSERDAGHWNLTIYGQRFIRLLRTVAAGPVQVNVGTPPPYAIGGWIGPWPFPEPGGTGFVS